MATLELTPAGIKTPTYDECEAQIMSDYREIYGDDIYLAPDSQDGQMIRIEALARFDAFQKLAMMYHSFNPDGVSGVGLSRLVKINGVTRNIATLSQADIRIVGQPGTVINRGVVSDIYKNKYNLPVFVTIPLTGEITVQALAQEAGELHVAAGEINRIETPTRGWQSAENTSAVVPGRPVETDFDLRGRRADSVSLPSLSTVEALRAGLLSVEGVLQAQVYENDTNEDATISSRPNDPSTLPPHSIACVVEGGDAQTVADTIRRRKGAGVYTHGDTEISTQDSAGIVMPVRFWRPHTVNVNVRVAITPLALWDSTTAIKIQTAVSEYINALNDGDSIVTRRIDTAVYSADDSTSAPTFEIETIEISNDGGTTWQSGNLNVAYYEQVETLPADVTVVVNA